VGVGNHIIDTIDIIMPLNDYADGTDSEGKILIEAHLFEDGTAIAIKMPAVPLYLIDKVDHVHAVMRGMSNDRFKTDHKCAVLDMLNGNHYKWVRYNLPDDVQCNTDHFNNKDGSLKIELTMAMKDLPFKGNKGQSVKTFLPFVVMKLAIEGNAKVLKSSAESSVDQLAEAFKNLLGNF
jgi:hypothetical protein